MTARPIALHRHFNARAATSDGERARGAFNAWGNSFPREELPFGRCVDIGGLPFVLARVGDFDHLEAAEQCVEFPETAASAIGLLAFGEMGPQQVDMVIEGSSGVHAMMIEAPAWLVTTDTNVDRALCCSHLHYPGDYELAYLRPAMWACATRLPHRGRWRRLRIGSNPLFHLAATTLLGCADG
jgi:hypothetical protein